MNLAKFRQIFKILGFIILLLVLFLMTIFAGKTASNYFAKAESCPVRNVSISQVTANSAVISWETDEVTQGRVEYGTSANNLTFSSPEAASGKIHNVSLTLLTPVTAYYYVIGIGETLCDTTGEICEQNCVPWDFTTSQVVYQEDLVVPLPTVTGESQPTRIPTKVPTPTKTKTTLPTVLPTVSATATPSTPIVASPTNSPTSSAEAAPTSSLSSFCQGVKENIGATSLVSSTWEQAKQYDIDGNGVINGLDIIKCQSQGK